MTSSEKVCLEWSDFQESIRKSFEYLRKDIDFADVTLACEDGVQVEAHQAILAAASPFFQDILGQKKHPHPLIYMRGVKSEDMAAILDLIYLGEASMSQANLNVFLILADELKLKGLNNIIDQDYYHLINKQRRTNSTKPLSKSESIKIKNHLQTSSDSQEVVSTTYPLIFVSAEVLKAQVKSMTRLGGPGRRQSQLICTVCGKEGEYNIIKYHVEMKHIQGVSLPCNLCNMTFRSNKRLLEHNTFHKKPEKFYCDECGKIFNRRRNLKTHLLTYTNGECVMKEELKKIRQAAAQKGWNLPENEEKESSDNTSEETIPTTVDGEEGLKDIENEKKTSKSGKEKVDSMSGISEYIDIVPYPKEESNEEIPDTDPIFDEKITAFVGMEELDAQIRSMIGKGESMGRHQRHSACTVCGKEGDFSNIKYHIEIKHIQGISLPCSVCDMIFKSRKRLREHMKSQHSLILEGNRPGRPRSNKEQDGNS